MPAGIDDIYERLVSRDESVRAKWNRITGKVDVIYEYANELVYDAGFVSYKVNVFIDTTDGAHVYPDI